MEAKLEVLEASWKHLGSILEALGGSWKLLEALGRLLEGLGSILKAFGGILGALGRLLGGSWKPRRRILRPSWAALEAKLGVLGPTWEHLGTNLDNFGAKLAVLEAT